MNPEKHHSKFAFSEEYQEFLKKIEIEYEEKYLFEFYNISCIYL